MPRRPRPFFHRGWWCTNVGGTRAKLASGRRSKAAAEDALISLLADRRLTSGRKTYSQLTVVEICDKFLDWVELHRSPRTYEDYRDWLRKWVKRHCNRRVTDIRSLDLEDWKIELADKKLAPATINHAVVAVKTCWSWAFKNDLLTANPLQKVQTLHCEGRERVLKPEEFRALLRHSDATFRQVLLTFRLTGVRPSEFCNLTWDQADFENHIWVIKRHKTTRTAKIRKPRIIPLAPIVERLLLWRLRKYGQTRHVFLNRKGNPWKRNAPQLRMRRLRERAGIGPNEFGEQIVMYTTRHTFGTEASAAGILDRRLADLLGHSDPKMTQKYIHLAYPDLHKAVQEATRRYLGSSQNGVISS